MKVNMSALNNALNFMDSNYGTNDFAEVYVSVSTKEKGRRKRELWMELSLKNKKNDPDKTFGLLIEKRYKENEKILADLLYQHLSLPGQEWRRKLGANVSLINNISVKGEFSIVKIACRYVNIDEVKFVLGEIFKIIYTDDILKTLYVSILDLVNEKEINFKPVDMFETMEGRIGIPEFSLN